jgi:hypothetical protein
MNKGIGKCIDVISSNGRRGIITNLQSGISVEKRRELEFIRGVSGIKSNTTRTLGFHIEQG